MKHTPIYILALLSLALPVIAQTQNNDLTDTISVQPIESPQVQGVREATPEEKEYARMMAEERREQEQIDTNLPAVNEHGQVQTAPDFYIPFYGAGWLPSWRLHKGLNVNVGTSVFSNWGGGHHYGTGFTQDISLMYVTNLSPKATLAIGGYLGNTTWHGNNYTTAGINAMLGYRFDEHWSAYAFVQKAFTSNNVERLGWYGRGYYPMGMYGYGRYGFAPYYGVDQRYMDRIGAGLRYEWGKYNQNSIQIQVEVDRMPQHSHSYDLQRYDYPTR